MRELEGVPEDLIKTLGRFLRLPPAHLFRYFEMKELEGVPEDLIKT
jgi:hypothetical protein